MEKGNRRPETGNRKPEYVEASGVPGSPFSPTDKK